MGAFVIVALLIVSPNTLSAKFLNSSSSKISRSLSASTGQRQSSSSSKVKGTSVFIVARNFENFICSIFSSTFLRRAPLSLSVLFSNSSMLPNSCINLVAVFSPIPGHPGILSEVSPINPKISITCLGCSIPNFCLISSIPLISKPLLPYLGL